MKNFIYIFSLPFFICCAQDNAQNRSAKSAPPDSLLARTISVSDGCDGCDLIYEGMPPVSEMSWQTSLINDSEQGDKMELSGVVYKQGGKQPAANIILYCYQTDAQGIYSPAADQKNGRRHGHIRGWLITNAKGENLIKTIRPAPYPRRDNPAHIHLIVKEPNKIEYYIDEFIFDDDPKITQDYKHTRENRGGSGIVQLSKNEKGVWVGTRNIVLGLNIPNYK